MAAAYPPGGTFLNTFKKSFVDVSVKKANNNAIDTTEFLDAAESFTAIFDLLGGAFGTVKSDITGNIKKVRERQLAFPDDSKTLQSLVSNEIKSKKHTATEGLLWLVRGLEFTCLALKHNLADPTEKTELSTSFRDAYGSTLKPHHSFLIKPIFSAAMSATPYRKDFYTKLSDTPDKLNEDLNAWLDALQSQVEILKAFLATKEAKW